MIRLAGSGASPPPGNRHVRPGTGRPGLADGVTVVTRIATVVCGRAIVLAGVVEGWGEVRRAPPSESILRGRPGQARVQA